MLLLCIVGGCIALFICYVLWCLGDGIYTLVSRRSIEAKRRQAKQALALVVTTRSDHTDDLFSVVLAHPKGKRLPKFQAGQYLSLLASINGKPVSRRYSLAQWQSSPKHYQLGIRKVHDGELSSWLHQHLQTGAKIEVLPPAGHFTLTQALADKTATDIVLIGAGIGITPVKAMLDKLQHTRKRIHLFHSARTAAELLWCDQLSSLAQSHAWFSYYPYLSQPTEAWSGLTGRIQAHDLTQTGAALNTTHFYMCAKLDMMLNIEQALIEQGVPANHIHWESFGTDTVNQDQQRYQVTIDGHGDYTFSGEPSLLQAMESWRIPIKADCRAGDCGECQINMIDGQYKATQPATCKIATDKILACCVVPASDIRVSM